MKWIGKHIWDFVSRFRNDVYLEDVDTGTIVSGGNLGLDSNNKIVKNTVSGGAGDITSVVAGTNLNGGATSGDATVNLDSDLTNINSIGLSGDVLIKSNGNINLQVDADNDGSNTINFVNGSGVTIGEINESGNLNIKGELTSNQGGTVPNKGSAGDFAVFDSNVVKKRTGSEVKTDLSINNVENKSSATIRGEIVSGDIPNNASDTTGNSATATKLAATKTINGVAFDGSSNITVTAAGSTLSDLVPVTKGGTGANNVGGARAALGVDAAGTDNSTNVTLAGTPDYITISGQEITRNQIDLTADVTGALPKANLATQNSYQYISFTGNATVPSDGDWMTVSANGISNHTWNTNLGSGDTTVGSSTVTIPTGAICQGIVVPYDCTLIGYASLIRSVGNHQSKVGLAVGVPTYNDFATFDCTLRAYNAADISAGPDTNYSQRPVRADYLTANTSLSAGNVIFPLIGSVASNSRTVQWNCTLVLKTTLV